MNLWRARTCGFIVALSSIGVFTSTGGCSSGDDGAVRHATLVEAPRREGSSPVNPIAGPSPRIAAPPAEDDPPGQGEDEVAVAPFHIIGRFDARDAAGPRLGWPGTEIRARFSGATLKVELADTGVSHYDVSVDGAPPTTLLVTGPRRPYVVAMGLAPGVHELVLTKRTETLTGVTQLFGFDGTLVPSPVPSGRRIELIGDSITCGYGVLGGDGSCPFSPETEAEPMAWGARAAKQLGALRMVTAFSGLGVLRNFDGDTTETMPQRYHRALANDPDSVWDHQAFDPHVVVVALGTNDFAGGKGDPGPGFEAAYTELLATVREAHPNARIVTATSPMLSAANHTKLRAYVVAAIAARAAAGDPKITLVDVDEQRESDGYGCGYHPSASTQQKMAARVVAHVEALMGW